MTSFTIYANGIDMGAYEGATENDAANAYAQAVGYADMADLAATLGKSEQEALDELQIEAR